MSKLSNSYLRVIWKGEVYYVIGEAKHEFPLPEGFTGYPFIRTYLITKVESVTRPGRKDKAIEVFAQDCRPLVSEIKTWLYLRTNLF